MTDCHTSNVARNISFRVQVEDIVDDERPPRGRDKHHAAVHIEGRTVTPVVQENLDRPVIAGHLENVLNDFQNRMTAVMEEHIKNNMLFFQINPGGDAAEPLKARSQEGRPRTSRPPRPELSRPPSKGKQPAVKLPTIEPFDGTIDPDDHLSAYKHQMYVQGVDDATWCKNFPATLKGVAQKWFNNSPPNSVNNFTELSILFTSHFVANRQEQKTSMHLGLRPGSFKFDLVKKKITTLIEALKEAEAFIHATEVCAEAKEPEPKKADEAVQPKKSLPKKAETWVMTLMTTSSKRSRRSKPAASVEPIEFNKDQYSILMETKDLHELKAPAEMKTPYRNRDKSKYCHFHKDCGHETNECKHLKRALEDLARKRKMNSYLPSSVRKFQKKDNRQGRRMDDESTNEDVVMVISGGFAAGGPTTRGHKNYLRELSQVMLTNHVEADPFPKIVVSEQDRGKIRTPHDDPLVVEMKIANLRVRQILIDTGSSTDIISVDCLSRLKFDENELVPVNHPIIGFGGG
ncbi:uncharacterized protein LOC104901278 [Beta vulgaris subsp. vulgaris]|uniref:uncharacterized protein LOC104901278 n=1 Tax=Beta vulgaris subsp. vulgaris TaxID=3555 RepID=UPI00053FB3F0|nr:uncharacterized protein LOC104901278 [Beta vulgaris subsp. vulgaris]